MLQSIKRKYLIRNFVVVSLFCLGIIGYFSYYKKELNSDESHFYDYYIKPTDLTEKIVFLWTPIQGSYRGYWGSDPVISTCRDRKINHKCLFTTHPDLIEKADIVLFAIEDIHTIQKQVQYETTLYGFFSVSDMF